MKKTILLGALMLSAAAGYAQESRQDVSISGFGLFQPSIAGSGGVYVRSSETLGGLASYRYLLTPHSGLELNYGFLQNTNYFQCCGNYTNNPIHTRQQEFSGAYVYGLTFKRFNPFVEGGVGAIIFTPILDGTYTLDAKRSTGIGAIYGGGVAYELSPSFDLRLEYRGTLVKAPSFVAIFKTNRYQEYSEPTLGVAYHF